MKATFTRKDKQQLRRDDINPGDSVTFHGTPDKAGTATFRRTFFYRHGRTAGQFTDYVTDYLERFFGLRVTIEDQGEVWQDWPKDSYWWVRVKPIERIEGPEVYYWLESSKAD